MGERRVVSADGTELAVMEAGDTDRPALVLIHGFPNTKEIWDGVIEALADRFHLVAYDVRGAGASAAPRAPAGYDFARLSDDFEAVATTTVPGKTIHLVGHDWGGLQGWEFATSPRLRGRLASFTAIAGPSLDQVAIGGRSLRRLADAWRSWYILLLLAPGGPELMSRMVAAGGGSAGAQPTIRHDVIRGANLYRRNIPRRLLRPRRDAVAQVPVQLIIPRGDRYIPLSYYRLAERYAPRLVRHEVDGPHWLPRTAPDLVATSIASFVAEAS